MYGVGEWREIRECHEKSMRERSPSALREAVGIRSRIHFSRYYMTPLIEKGLVARTDHENPMSPRQEYKLT